MATLEFIKVLELDSYYSLAQVARGVAQALGARSLRADTVAYFLNTDGRAMKSPPPAVLAEVPACPQVQDRDLSQYDLLLRR